MIFLSLNSIGGRSPWGYEMSITLQSDIGVVGYQLSPIHSITCGYVNLLQEYDPKLSMVKKRYCATGESSVSKLVNFWELRGGAGALFLVNFLKVMAPSGNLVLDLTIHNRYIAALEQNWESERLFNNLNRSRLWTELADYLVNCNCTDLD